MCSASTRYLGRSIRIRSRLPTQKDISLCGKNDCNGAVEYLEFRPSTELDVQAILFGCGYRTKNSFVRSSVHTIHSAPQNNRLHVLRPQISPKCSRASASRSDIRVALGRNTCSNLDTEMPHRQPPLIVVPLKQCTLPKSTRQIYINVPQCLILLAPHNPI